MNVSRPAERMAPYVSWEPARLFFERMRGVSTPERVDRARLLDYGVSPGNTPALLSALKFLGLVGDDGAPTDDFRALQTTGEEFRRNLERVIHAAYHDVFERFDLTAADRETLRNYFARAYSVSQARNALLFFGALCQQAGIPVSEDLRGAGDRAAGRTKSRVSRAAQSVTRRPRVEAQAATPVVGSRAPIATKAMEEETAVVLALEAIKILVDNLQLPTVTLVPGVDVEAIRAIADMRKRELDMVERLLNKVLEASRQHDPTVGPREQLADAGA